MKEWALWAGERLTSLLPKLELPIPCRRATAMRLRVYLDSELGLPLGFREPEAEQKFLKQLNPGDSIVDVGAHIGLYSILALSVPDTNVHIFEGHPTNVHRVLKNLRYNGVRDRATVYSMYSWSESTTLEIGTETNQFQASVTKKSDLFTGAYPLDDCLTNNQIDMIKIDVEGVAGRVLEGAQDILSNQRPICLIEVHSKDERLLVENQLEEYEYHIDKSISGNWFAIPLEDFHH